MRPQHLIPVFLMLLFACADGKVDTSKVQAEMKAREVKVVPEAKIVERAFFVGDSLLQSLDPAKRTSSDWGKVHSWKLSGLNVDCTLYAISNTYALAEKEQQVFEAYQYSAENSLEAEPNVQRLPEEIMVYNAPFINEGKLAGMWSIQLPRKHLILTIED